MKKLSLFLLLLTSYITFSQEVNMDTIYGDVKSVKEKLIFANNTHEINKFTKLDSDYGHARIMFPTFLKRSFKRNWYNSPSYSYINYYKTFNKNGKAKQEIWYERNGKTALNHSYIYDKKNNLIQLKVKHYDKEYTFRNYSYKKDKIKTSLLFVSDDINSYTYREYIYDKKMNLIEVVKYNEDGFSSGNYYVYDSLKRKIEHGYYKAYLKNKKTNKIEKNRNKKGYIIEKFIYTNKLDEKIKYYNEFDSLGNQKISNKTIYKYKNNLLKNKYFVIRGDTLSTKLYTYDSKKRKSSCIYKYLYSSNNIEKINYFYDKKDLIVGLKILRKGKVINVRFEYAFDKHKNWIKQIKYVDGIKKNILKRKIHYFNH